MLVSYLRTLRYAETDVDCETRRHRRTALHRLRCTRLAWAQELQHVAPQTSPAHYSTTAQCNERECAGPSAVLPWPTQTTQAGGQAVAIAIPDLHFKARPGPARVGLGWGWVAECWRRARVCNACWYTAVY